MSYNLGVGNGVFVLGNQGLGDQIVMKGIYSYYASLNEKCIIPVCDRYKSSIVRLTQDIENVFVVGYRMEIWQPNMLAHRDFLVNRGYTSINLGLFYVCLPVQCFAFCLLQVILVLFMVFVCLSRCFLELTCTFFILGWSSCCVSSHLVLFWSILTSCHRSNCLLLLLSC